MNKSTKRLNTKEFIKRAKKIHADNYEYTLVHYENTRTKIKIICKPCNLVFEQKPNNHLNGQGCPNCYGNKTSTTEQFIRKAEKIHNGIYDYTLCTYKNARAKIKIICKTHGIFEQSPNGHLSGLGCPTCGGVKKLTKLEFITRAKNIHGNLYNYDKFEYINNKTKSDILCLEHGIFKQTPDAHINRFHGCPVCKISVGEKRIRNILIEKNISFVMEHSFEDCRNPKTNYKLRFDFYLPNLNTCIEYDGPQHYGHKLNGKLQYNDTDIHFRDNVKNKYCETNNIKLIRIPYWELQSIQDHIQF